MNRITRIVAAAVALLVLVPSAVVAAEPGPTLSGAVLNVDGSPATVTFLQTRQISVDNQTVYREVTAEADGTFSLELEPWLDSVVVITAVGVHGEPLIDEEGCRTTIDPGGTVELILTSLDAPLTVTVTLDREFTGAVCEATAVARPNVTLPPTDTGTPTTTLSSNPSIAPFVAVIAIASLALLLLPPRPCGSSHTGVHQRAADVRRCG